MNRVHTNCRYFRKQHRVLWWRNMGKLWHHCRFRCHEWSERGGPMSVLGSLCLARLSTGRGWASVGGNLVLLFQHRQSPSYTFVKQTLKWVCYLMPFWRLQSGFCGFSRHSSICKLCSSDIYVSETVCILLFPMFQTRTVTRLLPVELGKE